MYVVGIHEYKVMSKNVQHFMHGLSTFEKGFFFFARAVAVSLQMFYWYVCRLPFIATIRFLIATPITFSPLRFLHPLLLFHRPHFVYVRPYVSLFTRKSTCLLAFKLEVYDPLIGFLLYNRVLFIMLNRQLKKETFLIKWGLSKNLQCMILWNCSYCYKYDKFFYWDCFFLLFF